MSEDLYNFGKIILQLCVYMTKPNEFRVLIENEFENRIFVFDLAKYYNLNQIFFAK